jgi:iron complex outermembrane recepter protein
VSVERSRLKQRLFQPLSALPNHFLGNSKHMKNQNLLSQTIKFVLLGSASAMVAMPAFAQDEEVETLEKVTVTGSRIKRTEAETAQPITIVTRDAIEKSGFTSVGDILQRLPEIGPSINTQFNNGGDGSTTIDLRNLGANRTLVLMNGRRWVPGIGGAVDINTIPTAIIESIEVLKDGASAIYGSDAIAGVVNIITRKNYDGASASGFYGQNAEGDNTRYAADFTIGTSNDNGSVSISASYVKEEPVFAGDRAQSAVPNFGLNPRATGSSTTPSGRYTVTGRTGTFTNSGATTGQNVATQYRPFDLATDLYNFAPDNYLITPLERASIFGEGSYQLADWVNFNAHILYNNRKSDQLLAAIPVVLGNITSGVAGGINVAANNPYNTFGAPVVAIQRRFNETGGRQSIRDTNTYRFGGGFTGSFDFAERALDWETGYSYTTNKETSLGKGNLNLARVRTALTAFDADPGVGFDPRCGTAGANAATPLVGATLVAGCVPLNILGGPGSITPAMLNYVTFTGIDKLDTTTTNYFASLTGTLFELPAGPLGASIGYEYRKESGEDIPDAITAAGETTGNSRLPTGGSFSVDEVYGEFLVPILADAPMAELLELKFSGRYSDFSTFGDTTNIAAGFQWKPISDLKIRGNYNEGFRAPTILELFRGVSDNFPQLSDPCLVGQFGSRARQDAATIGRCNSGFAGIAAVPLTAGAAPAQANGQIRTQVGGEATLTPEESEGYTVGFVYSPSYFEGFDMSVDWWQIEIDNVIGGRAAGTLLTQCYRDANVPACSRISRNPETGFITNVLATGENVGFNDIEGVDVGFGYRLPEFSFGQFNTRLDSTYFIREEAANLAFNPTVPFSYFSNNPVNSTVGIYAGRGGTTNRVKSNLAVDWSLGAWSANWTARYTSQAVENCGAAYISLNVSLCQGVEGAARVGGVTQIRNRISSVTFHDVSVAYAFDWDGSVRIGGSNVFDKQLPLVTNTFANSFDPAFDIPGGFFYAQYNQKF